jgi:hypothetical protein
MIAGMFVFGKPHNIIDEHDHYMDVYSFLPISFFFSLSSGDLNARVVEKSTRFFRALINGGEPREVGDGPNAAPGESPSSYVIEKSTRFFAR